MTRGPWSVRRLTIPGEPLGKARPRVTRHGTYTPKATREAEARIRAAWDAEHGHLGEPDASARFGLQVTFWRKARHRRDVDNLAKLVMDALNGAPGAWADDYQVEHLVARVRWVEDKADTRTTVAVWPLGEVPMVQALTTPE